MNLLTSAKLTNLSGYTSAGTTAVSGTAVDMAGYDSVMFFGRFGTAAADNLLHVEGSTAASTGPFEDLTGTAVGAGASDETQAIEIVRTKYRYLRPVADRGTSSTLVGMWGIQHGARSCPVDNTVAGTIHSEISVSPTTGTK